MKTPTKEQRLRKDVYDLSMLASRRSRNLEETSWDLTPNPKAWTIERLRDIRFVLYRISGTAVRLQIVSQLWSGYAEVRLNARNPDVRAEIGADRAVKLGFHGRGINMRGRTPALTLRLAVKQVTWDLAQQWAKTHKHQLAMAEKSYRLSRLDLARAKVYSCEADLVDARRELRAALKENAKALPR